MTARQRRAVVSGIIFIALGIMFLLEALEVYDIPTATLWPVLFIALGIGVLAGIGGDTDDD